MDDPHNTTSKNEENKNYKGGKRGQGTTVGGKGRLEITVNVFKLTPEVAPKVAAEVVLEVAVVEFKVGRRREAVGKVN